MDSQLNQEFFNELALNEKNSENVTADAAVESNQELSENINCKANQAELDANNQNTEIQSFVDKILTPIETFNRCWIDQDGHRVCI